MVGQIFSIAGVFASALTLLATSGQAWAWGWKKVEGGQIPSGAVYYGVEGNQSYICGNWYADGPNSGRIEGDRCVFSYKGAEQVMESYYALMAPEGYSWIEFTKYDQPPENAIFNAPQSLNPRSYLCGVLFNGRYLTGQIYDRLCHVALDKKDYYFGYYMIPVRN